MTILIPPERQHEEYVILEHGYTEGQNLTFEYCSASGRNASFAELASELVSLQVDVKRGAFAQPPAASSYLRLTFAPGPAK